MLKDTTASCPVIFNCQVLILTVYFFYGVLIFLTMDLGTDIKKKEIIKTEISHNYLLYLCTFRYSVDNRVDKYEIYYTCDSLYTEDASFCLI
jgi:hypothetical protein